MDNIIENIAKQMYCIKCKENTENIDPNIVFTKNNKKMIKAICNICNNNKTRFTK